MLNNLASFGLLYENKISLNVDTLLPSLEVIAASTLKPNHAVVGHLTKFRATWTSPGELTDTTAEDKDRLECIEFHCLETNTWLEFGCPHSIEGFFIIRLHLIEQKVLKISPN